MEARVYFVQPAKSARRTSSGAAPRAPPEQTPCAAIASAAAEVAEVAEVAKIPVAAEAA
jgi:hypothetical protein